MFLCYSMCFHIFSYCSIYIQNCSMMFDVFPFIFILFYNFPYISFISILFNYSISFNVLQFISILFYLVSLCLNIYIYIYIYIYIFVFIYCLYCRERVLNAANHGFNDTYNTTTIGETYLENIPLRKLSWITVV